MTTFQQFLTWLFGFITPTTWLAIILSLLGLGCTGSGDGGQLTLTDFLEAADRHEVEYELDIELDRPGEVYAKQSAGIDSGFRARGSIKGKGNRENLVTSGVE